MKKANKKSKHSYKPAKTNNFKIHKIKSHKVSKTIKHKISASPKKSALAIASSTTRTNFTSFGIKDGQYYKKIDLLKSEIERMHTFLLRIHDNYSNYKNKAPAVQIYEPYLKSLIMKVELMSKLLQLVDQDFQSDKNVVKQLLAAKTTLNLKNGDFDHVINNAILRNIYENMQDSSSVIEKEMQITFGLGNSLKHFVDHLKDISEIPRYDKENEAFYQNLNAELKMLKYSTKRFAELITLEKDEESEIQTKLANLEKTMELSH